MFKSAAYSSITRARNSFSLSESIDLAYLSSKKIFLLIEEKNYIEALSLFPLLFDKKDILIVPSNKTFQKIGPPGFNTIGTHYDERFAHCAKQNFDSAKLIICPNQSSVVDYYTHTHPVEINSKTTHSNMVSLLTSLNYKRVDFVENIYEYCIKGDIIDFFSPLYLHPVRSDFYEKNPSMYYYNIHTGLPRDGFFDSLWLSKKTNIKKRLDLCSHLKGLGYVILDVYSVNKEKACVTSYKDQKKPLKTKTIKTILNSKFLYQGNVFLDEKFEEPITNNTKPITESFEKGDLVCHEDFGVGLYKQLIVEEDGDESVQIQYNDGLIRLSVKSLYKLSFVSREKKDERLLNSLNKKNVWARKKKKIQKEADLYVDKIVSIYTNKKKAFREPFVFGGEIENSFIDSFEYEDTKDQGVVWGEIKEDFDGTKPMSRLLCGDVGFGKTEVAARALFRVSVNSKQSILLVPTSVLATQQHKVLSERLGAFGVQVGLLRGGLGVKQKQKIKDEWLNKKYDVLITTTAVFYDTSFIKCASFFVVDEEHRFGVKYKDLFINTFKNIDVLYLSATPIPRTLHLSLLGFHDISTLSTPPVQRKPITTFISYFEDSLIKNIVSYEIARGGQIFFLHNKIKTIGSVKNYLSNLCPNINIGVAHSKLGHKKLRDVFLEFVDKKTNFLLCSSVIGSGVDIPNANTIIVDGANNFGLSQLHQIRGRVGRGEKQGFAYLLVPKNKKLSSSATKRLKTIETNTQLGSGYSIAHDDLEIRGGGSLFGYKQSGGFIDVGYDYYSKSLSKSFSNAINQKYVSNVDTFVYNVPFSCFFSKKYIPSDKERIRKIRELGSFYSFSLFNSFSKGLVETYGPLPISVENLINMRILSLFSCKLFIRKVVYSEGTFSLFFDESFSGVGRLLSFLNNNGSAFFIKNHFFKKVDGFVLVFLVLQKTVVSVLDLKKIIKGLYEFCEK